MSVPEKRSKHQCIWHDSILLNYSLDKEYINRDFDMNCLISGFKKLFNKRFAFPPLYHELCILLLAASKDRWVPRMLFVF